MLVYSGSNGCQKFCRYLTSIEFIASQPLTLALGFGNFEGRSRIWSQEKEGAEPIVRELKSTTVALKPSTIQAALWRTVMVIEALHLSPDGRWLAAAPFNTAVYVYDLLDPDLALYTLVGHTAVRNFTIYVHDLLSELLRDSSRSVDLLLRESLGFDGAQWHAGPERILPSSPFPPPLS